MSGIDEKGVVPLREQACLLLSGGMDSVACLRWAKAEFRDVRALGFDYGQPHRDAELVAAGTIARRNGIPFEVVVLADAFLPSGLLDRVPQHDEGPVGALHRAFVPGRNLVFLSLALGRACQWWSGDFEIVIGSTAEDAAGFPDCREKFLKAADATLSAAVGRKIHVAAPYVRMTKIRMLADVAGRYPSGIADIQESWSCYFGKGPCGTCTPCVLRKAAFDHHGLSDRCVAPVMTGGDVERERRLSG